LKVSDLMTRDVPTISPEASLRDAARLMREVDAPLPVCEGDRLLGMVSAKDITLRATAEGRDADRTLVLDVMTPEVVCCYGDDEIEHARRLMETSRLGRLVVLDEDRRPVGLIALADIPREQQRARS
jgi:CBS domain-containing protein